MSIDKKTQYKQKLARARMRLQNLLTSLSEEQWQTPVIGEDQTWTVLDVVAHLVENEGAMSIHVHKIRQGKETVPEGFDLDKWNAGLKERMENPTSQELLQSLDQTRTRTLAELESLKDEEWSLQGRHPLRGMITVEQYYKTMAMHETWHTNDIEKALGVG